MPTMISVQEALPHVRSRPHFGVVVSLRVRRMLNGLRNTSRLVFSDASTTHEIDPIVNSAHSPEQVRRTCRSHCKNSRARRRLRAFQLERQLRHRLLPLILRRFRGASASE